MARTKMQHGAMIETLTPEEAAALIRTARAEDRSMRVRAAATVKLDNSGNGQDEVYTVPVGFEFEARRVSLDLDSASDALTGVIPLASTPGARPANLNPQVSAANTAQAPTIPSNAGQRTTVDEIVLFASGAGNATVSITDGSTTVDFGTVPLTTGPTVLQVNKTFGINNIVTINVGAAGVGVTTTVSASGHTGTVVSAVIEYLRSGTRIEYAQPQYGSAYQVPGVQTWGAEQGPYFRNGEVMEVRVKGLTPSATLDITVEGILSRPERAAKS